MMPHGILTKLLGIWSIQLENTTVFREYSHRQLIFRKWPAGSLPAPKLGLRQKEQGVPVEADDDGRPKAEGIRHGDMSVELPVKMPFSFSLCEFSTESKQEQEEQAKLQRGTEHLVQILGCTLWLNKRFRQLSVSFLLSLLSGAAIRTQWQVRHGWGWVSVKYLISLILAVFFNPFCTLGNGVRKNSSASAGNWTASDNENI